MSQQQHLTTQPGIYISGKFWDEESGPQFLYECLINCGISPDLLEGIDENVYYDQDPSAGKRPYRWATTQTELTNAVKSGLSVWSFDEEISVPVTEGITLAYDPEEKKAHLISPSTTVPDRFLKFEIQTSQCPFLLASAQKNPLRVDEPRLTHLGYLLCPISHDPVEDQKAKETIRTALRESLHAKVVLTTASTRMAKPRRAEGAGQPDRRKSNLAILNHGEVQSLLGNTDMQLLAICVKRPQRHFGSKGHLQIVTKATLSKLGNTDFGTPYFATKMEAFRCLVNTAKHWFKDYGYYHFRETSVERESMADLRWECRNLFASPVAINFDLRTLSVQINCRRSPQNDQKAAELYAHLCSEGFVLYENLQPVFRKRSKAVEKLHRLAPALEYVIGYEKMKRQLQYEHLESEVEEYMDPREEAQNLVWRDREGRPLPDLSGRADPDDELIELGSINSQPSADSTSKQDEEEEEEEEKKEHHLADQGNIRTTQQHKKRKQPTWTFPLSYVPYRPNNNQSQQQQQHASSGSYREGKGEGTLVNMQKVGEAAQLVGGPPQKQNGVSNDTEY